MVENTAKDKKIKTNEFEFQNLTYVTARINFTLGKTTSTVYIDNKCVINLIDKNFLKTQIPNATIHEIKTPIKVKDIGSNKYNANKYVILRIYFVGKD